MYEKSDAELVAQARRDDPDAFRLLIERYQVMALALALRLVADQETARDLVQESLLRAYLSLETLRDESRFRSWFYGIVLNVCRSFRSSRKTDDLSLDALRDGKPFMVTAPFCVFPDPQEFLEQQELQQAMLEALQVLSPKNRAVALLFYYNDASLQEIATKLDLSLATVKGRLHKGRIQLKRHLMTLYPELEQQMPGKRRKKMMVQVTFTGCTIPRPQDPSVWAVLLDHQRERVLPLKLTRAAKQPLATRIYDMSLQGPDLSDPVGIDFVANLLQAMGGTIEEVRIEELQEHVLYAKVRLKSQSGSHEVKARVSDGLSFAMQTNSPIFVENTILDRLGMDLPMDDGRPWEHRFKEMMLRFAGMPIPAGLAQSKPRFKQPENMHFEHGLDHWDLNQHVPHPVGEAPQLYYESGIDPNSPQGTTSGYLKATSGDPPQYAVLRQGILADDYRGQRIRLSGDVKAEGVEHQAGLYVRIVDPNRTLTIENRQEWTVQGTHDWKRCETSIDVPQDAVFVLFGLILFGKGQIWLANVQLEVIK